MKNNFLRNEHAIILCLIAVIGIFYAFTIRTGQGWGDDFALFLLHAKNISTGNAYGDTGFIYNPLSQSYSPQFYPPGFPLLLAPLYALFGLYLTPYKILLLLIFLWMLWLIYLLLKQKIAFGYLVVILIIFGFSPYMWGLSDSILADFPATAFIFFTLCLEKKRSEKNTLSLAIAEGLSAYAAFAMRATGIVLIPALLYRFFIEKKRKDKNFLYVLLAFFMPAVAQSFVMPKGVGYTEMMLGKYEGWHLNRIVGSVITSVNRYIADFQSLSLLGNTNAALNTLLATCCFALFITGWYLHAKKYFSFIDIFLLLFFGAIFIWPFYQGIRYLLPVLPFYLYFIFTAVAHIDIAWFRKTILSAVIFSFLAIYIGFYIHTNYGEVEYGVDYIENQEIFQYIKEHTDADAVIMSTKPRAFCLYTERNGIVFPDPTDAGIYYKCLADYNVDYIVTGVIDYFTYAAQNAHDDTIKFSPVFKNDSFEMFRVNP